MLESLNAFKVLMVAANLIILYVVLRKILFKPVTQFMENRTRAIKDSIDNAEKAKSEAAQYRQQYEDQLSTAKGQGEAIIEEAHIKGDKEYDRILAAAKLDAEKVLEKAREEIAMERDQMLKEIRAHVAGLALAAASKVIEANMDTEANRVLVDRFIDEAGVA